MARHAEKPELTGEVLYSAWKDADGNTLRSKQAIADFHGLTYGQVAGRIGRYVQTLEEGAPPEKPQLFMVNLGSPIEETGDAVVVSDIQAPTTDLDWARLVVPVAQQYNIRRLILNGDSLNVDWLSGYTAIVQQPRASQEIDAISYLLEEWSRWFEDIIYMPGNHETRFLRANMGNLNIENLVSLFHAPKVRATNFDHMTLHTEQGKWFIAHGSSYSVNQLVVAEQMALKYQANVIVGHQHHAAMGYDR